MESLTANDAKTQFGDLLLRAQREPITINKNGKPVAVVISTEEYKYLESLKLKQLKEKIKRGVQQIKQGDTVEGEAFFEELLNKKGD